MIVINIILLRERMRHPEQGLFVDTDIVGTIITWYHFPLVPGFAGLYESRTPDVKRFVTCTLLIMGDPRPRKDMTRCRRCFLWLVRCRRCFLNLIGCRRFYLCFVCCRRCFLLVCCRTCFLHLIRCRRWFLLSFVRCRRCFHYLFNCRRCFFYLIHCRRCFLYLCCRRSFLLADCWKVRLQTEEQPETLK